MVEKRRKLRSDTVLAGTLGFFVALGSPARAVAQSKDDAGASGWDLPAESPEAPAELPPPKPRQETSPKTPDAEPSARPAPREQSPPPPPSELPAPRRVEPRPPPGPRFPVTFQAPENTSVSVRGPGLREPLECSGTCTFDLWEKTYWLEIQSSDRVWTMPVALHENQRVVIDAPNGSARETGIAVVVIGGSIFSVAGLVTYLMLVECSSGGGSYDGSQCDSNQDVLPYWLAATGIGAAVSALGIGLVLSNDKPSIDIQPAFGEHARRASGTFVGLGAVDRTTLPGLTLRTSF